MRIKSRFNGAFVMRSLKVLGIEWTTSGPLIFFGKLREHARILFPAGRRDAFPYAWEAIFALICVRGSLAHLP